MLKEIFISDVFAQSQEAVASTNESSLTSMIPLLLIFAIFYFLIVRPQSRKMKDHQEMVKSLKIGDKIITNGGILGVVTDIFAEENQVEIEIADGVKIKMLKSYVGELAKPKEVKSEKIKK